MNVTTNVQRNAGASHCFDQILKLAGYGFRQDERAAFLVARQDGTLDCVIWPKTNGYQSAHWDGVVPRNTFAIAHTHPRALPSPSTHDFVEAKRLGMPVYVITSSGVNVALPGR